MKTCIHCGAEITDSRRKLYCSHTCYVRYSSRKEYHNNIDKEREKAKIKNSKPETKTRYKNTKKKHLEWALSVGIKHSQLRLYGYTFLKEHPEVVETLKLMNTKIKQTEEEIKKYQKQYRALNAEKIKETKRKWYEKRKENKIV